MLEHPQKKHFRTRAHSNVLNANDFWFPATPADVPVAQYYPARPTERIEFVDVGCGYGSLLLALSAHFPQQLSLGIEIRPKVVEYVQRRVLALRHEASRAAAEKTDADESAAAAAIASAEGSQTKAVENGGPQRSGASEALPPNFSHAQLKEHALVDHPTHDRPTHDNVWAVHNNAMRFLPNFFEKGQLTKLFFCFPDPHFKRKNHRKRIISTPLLAEFAYVIRPGGLVYLITDVSELMEWMVVHLTPSILFERLSREELKSDPTVPLLIHTDEGLKVQRNNGNMFIAAFRKRVDPSIQRDEPKVLGNDEAALAASDAGYTPEPGGERRGMTW